MVGKMRSYSLINRLTLVADILGSFIKRNQWRILLFFRRGYQNKDYVPLQERLSFLGTYGEDYAFEVKEDCKRTIIEQADKVLDGYCNVLGYNGKRGVDDWSTDLKTSFLWKPGRFYTDYVQINLNNSSDVKVPWEISRGHHLLLLAQAYKITHKNKYSDAIQTQLYSWIRNNPLMKSINWTCSMEVAIRAINWMYALQMAGNTLSNEFAKVIVKSLYNHGFFIMNNLEKQGRYSANHYMSDIVGLLYLGRLFNNTKVGKGWYDFALQEFYYEIRTQVLPSGFHYERSVSYHRLVLEMIAYSCVLLCNIGESIPADIEYRVRQMFKVTDAYLKPNGHAPAIGDEDDGRFLPFVPFEFHDHKYLLDYAQKFNVDYRNAFCLDVWNDAGMAVMKKNGVYLFVNNAGLSRYPNIGENGGSHTHCDLLSFELATEIGDIIVDPGTYTYTANAMKRNEFRSTRKHNTIMVDAIEQYEFDDVNMFRMKNMSTPGAIECQREDGKEVLIASYVRNLGKDNLSHHRSFELSGSALVIVDIVRLAGEHRMKQYFHLAADCDVDDEGTYVSIMKKGHIYMMSFVMEDKNDSFDVKIMDDTVSPSYGIETDSKTIVMSSAFIGECKIKTIIDFNSSPLRFVDTE